MCETKTLDYYNKNASSFAEATVDVDFYDTQKHFQNLLPEQGYILDFGCGSGRDIKYFLSQHFQVDASFTHLSSMVILKEREMDAIL